MGIVDGIKSDKTKRGLPGKSQWQTWRRGPDVLSTSSPPWHRRSITRLRQGFSGATPVVPIGVRPSHTATGNNPKPRTEGNYRVSLRKLSKRQLLHVFHRVITLGAALLYLVIALEGVIATLEALAGVPNPLLSFTSSYETQLIGSLAGNSTIRDSTLMKLLDSQMAARSDTMYIDLDGDYISFSHCSQSSSTDAIYSNVFLRQVYANIVAGASHHINFLKSSHGELILPVVDCTSGAIVFEDSSVAKIFYLVRNLQPQPGLGGADEVAIVVLTLSNQVYEAPSHDERGPFGAATLSIIFDMSTTTEVEYHFLGSTGFPFKTLNFHPYELLETTDDLYWKLRLIPRGGDEAAQVILTTCRTGFYWKSASYQSNINQELWALPSEPHLSLTSMSWLGIPVTQNSWAWVHLIHLVFDAQTFTQLVILMIVIYRNWQVGKLWVGDAFSPIANTLMLRGGYVCISWTIDQLWTLTEYCMSIANKVSEVEEVFVHETVIHADLMTMFLMSASIAGKLLQERIDPPLTMLMFELGFYTSKTVLSGIPSIADTLVKKTEADYALGVVETDMVTTSISPMGLWSAHRMKSKDGEMLVIVLLPLLVSFAILICLTLAQKMWRGYRIRKGKVHVQFNRSSIRSSRHSTAEESTDSRGSVSGHAHSSYTQFELATGVELRHRFGVLCSYESARIVKGMTFASADGVYSSGFVIINERFLVATEDLATIFLMKLLRLRFRSVYVYDVEGHEVQAMARLVYPHSVSFRDLLRLNINMLS